MAELERDLRALGALLEYPPEPDLVPAVRARLAQRERRWRRPLVLALAAVVLALAVAFAVPPARSAILRFFHLGGITVERVEKLPPVSRRSPVAGLRGPMSLEQARRLAGFPLLLPHLTPRRAYAEEGIVAMLLHVEGVEGPVLFAEFRGEGLGVVKKAIERQTIVEPVRVGNSDGLWLQGAPHVVTYLDARGRARVRTTRLAGNVLAWTRGATTFRLEGALTREQALHIARFVR
ncbi:MAG: hypothetical protein ICV67_08310 [Thermoleophilia bacterium]|nr:hypothetical protein [Thermoleophilia bacterium]